MPGIKPATIKLILRKKIREWLSSIEHEELRKELGDNVIVTGGAITSMLLGEKINDYDFYLRTRESTLRASVYYALMFNKINEIKVNKHVKPYKVEVRTENRKNIKNETEERIVFKLQSAGIVSETQAEYNYFEGSGEAATDDFAESLSDSDAVMHDPTDDTVALIEDTNEALKKAEDKKPYRPIFITDNAVSLANRVQLITRFYGPPEEIHKNFDFIHATCWYDYKNNHLELPNEALKAILSKTLIYSGSLYPIASIFRIRKFLNRGWRISVGQMMKIIWQINEINLKDFDILKEQLLGVDVAYMHQLVTELQNTKAHEKIDSAYVTAILDKIFDE
jgi:hypothetical protein